MTELNRKKRRNKKTRKAEMTNKKKGLREDKRSTYIHIILQKHFWNTKDRGRVSWEDRSLTLSRSRLCPYSSRMVVPLCITPLPVIIHVPGEGEEASSVSSRMKRDYSQPSGRLLDFMRLCGTTSQTISQYTLVSLSRTSNRVANYRADGMSSTTEFSQQCLNYLHNQ